MEMNLDFDNYSKLDSGVIRLNESRMVWQHRRQGRNSWYNWLKHIIMQAIVVKTGLKTCKSCVTWLEWWKCVWGHWIVLKIIMINFKALKQTKWNYHIFKDDGLAVSITTLLSPKNSYSFPPPTLLTLQNFDSKLNVCI